MRRTEGSPLAIQMAFVSEAYCHILPPLLRHRVLGILDVGGCGVLYSPYRTARLTRRDPRGTVQTRSIPLDHASSWTIFSSSLSCGSTNSNMARSAASDPPWVRDTARSAHSAACCFAPLLLPLPRTRACTWRSPSSTHNPTSRLPNRKGIKRCVRAPTTGTAPASSVSCAAPSGVARALWCSRGSMDPRTAMIF